MARRANAKKPEIGEMVDQLVAALLDATDFDDEELMAAIDADNERMIREAAKSPPRKRPS